MFGAVPLSPVSLLPSSACSLFSAISLNRKLISFFSTSHHNPNFALFQPSSCDKAHLITLPAHPIKDHFHPNIIEVSKIFMSQRFGGGGKYPQKRSAKSPPRKQWQAELQWTWEGWVYTLIKVCWSILSGSYKKQNTFFSHQVFSSVRC